LDGILVIGDKTGCIKAQNVQKKIDDHCSEMKEVTTRLQYKKLARFFAHNGDISGMEISKSKNTFVSSDTLENVVTVSHSKTLRRIPI